MKQNTLKTFIKNSILFLAGSIFSKLLNFILLPMYTSYIPTADFGVYDIVTMMIQMISSVVYFEIWSAMLRYLYDYDDLKKPRVVKSSAFIFAGSTVVFILVGTVFCVLYGVDHIPLIILWGITTSLATYLSFLARGVGKNVDFAVSGILNTAVCLGLNIVLIIYVKMDYTALYLGGIGGMVVQTLYLLFRVGIFKRTIKAKFSKKLTREMLRYALPLCLNTAAYWLLHSAARLIYNYLCGDSASGIFSVGNKFGTIIVLATTCFTYAWQDISFSESRDGVNVKLYSFASKKYLLFLSGALSVALPVLKIVFPLLVKGDYIEAVNYVPLFLIVAVASGYSAFIGNIFYAIKDTKIISISTVIAGVITVGLAFPLIGLFGANGANIAVLTGFVVNIMIRFVILNKKIGFRIPVGPLVFSITWITISTVLYLCINTWMSVLVFLANAALMIAVFKSDILSVIKKH